MSHLPSDLDYIISANTHNGVFDWTNAKPVEKAFFVRLAKESGTLAKFIEKVESL